MQVNTLFWLLVSMVQTEMLWRRNSPGFRPSKLHPSQCRRVRYCKTLQDVKQMMLSLPLKFASRSLMAQRLFAWLTLCT